MPLDRLRLVSRHWFRNLLRRRQVEQELDAELASCLEMLIEDKVASGMTREEARRAARRELGGIDQIKERVRDVRAGARLERLAQDLRGAARSLRQSPAFSAAAVATLAIGLTLCAVTLSVVNAYFVRGLPYPEADRLYSVIFAAPGEEAPQGLRALDWESLGDTLEHTIAWDLDVFYLTDSERPEQAPGAWITPGFVAGFGVRPAVGRNFEPTDFQVGRPQVALISHRLWQRRFGGGADVLGRRFQAYVSDRPDEAEVFTIVGVLPDGFWHVNPYTDVLVPLRATSYPYIVRLRQGVPPRVAAERITALVRSSTETLGEDWRASLIGTRARYTAEMVPVVRAVGLAVGLVLLITSINVAMLFVVRTKRRETELAVRLALGCTRARLARLLFVEAVLLGGAATAAALVGGRLLTASFGLEVEQQLGRGVPGGLSAFELSGTVIVGTIACGLLCTLLFTLPPLAAAWRTDIGLARTGSGVGERGGRLASRSLLVVGEVAVSLALLAGSALLVSSAYRMLQVDFGLDTDRTMAASLSLRPRSYPDAASRSAFFGRLVERLGDVPGFEAVAMSDLWPLQPPRLQRVETEGADGVAAADAGILGVSPGYFEVLGVRLLEGRPFGGQDRAQTERVAIVSETLARRLAPQSSIVGRRLDIRRGSPAMTMGVEPAGDGAPPNGLLVVGVVADVRQGHADENLADLYLPLSQGGPRFAWILARVPGFAPTFEDEIWSAVSDIDSSVSLGTPQALQRGVDEERARPRFLASLLSGFAAFAALLALVGVYSVIAYAVRQRRREVAVRMAVGADPTAVIRLFLRQGSTVLAAGLALGTGGALGVSRALESQLFGVGASDPRLLAATAVGFGVCGLVAIAWPAIRATSIDPAVTLRAD